MLQEFLMQNLALHVFSGAYLQTHKSTCSLEKEFQAASETVLYYILLPPSKSKILRHAIEYVETSTFQAAPVVLQEGCSR